ncbi:cyclin-dependent kinase 2-interacting protein-like [Hetaerina americana]|uniref:cyclin-dependent kinase 2-interacting protein-like n=1 Tax=Hetaerina americana TaxID=62018 RepID=UPI003A7F1EE6
MNSDTNASPSHPRQDEEVKFSPVFVRQSPVSRTPQRGNITGNPRKVRDTVADLYNLVQKWNSSHLAGAEILAKIHCLKMSTMDPMAKDEKDVYPEGIQYYCDSLENVCKELTGIVNRMELCSKQLLAMCDLENYQQQARENVEAAGPPMFLTWPVERFAQVSNNLVSQFASELEVKNLILEGVCHCTSREALMFHVAAWAHQPTMINENEVRCQMEAMLIETGYR